MLLNWLKQIWIKIIQPDPVARAILYQNNKIFVNNNGLKTNPEKGTVIHKINYSQAESIAQIIKEYAIWDDIPLTYILACLCIESCFDPECENGNFLGSNPDKTPDGYDVGIAQIKLKYFMETYRMTVNQARIYVKNVTNAVRHFNSQMLGLMDYSSKLQWTDDCKKKNPLVNNHYYVATCGYNFGRTGVVEQLKEGNAPNHGQHVVDLEKWFAKELNRRSIFE